MPSSSFEFASSWSFVGPTGLGQRAQRAVQSADLGVQFGRPSAAVQFGRPRQCQAPGAPMPRATVTFSFIIIIITQRADCDGACGWICAAGGRRPCRVAATSAATSACLPISHGVASSRAHPCSDVSCTDCDGACGAICDMQNEKRGLRFARSSGAAYQSRRECGSPGGPSPRARVSHELPRDP